jgi:GNAT superfamily N-acetyltransferase
MNYFIDAYTPDLAEELVHLWRESKRAALADYHEPHDFAGFLKFLQEVLVPTHLIQVARDSTSGQLLGFVAVRGEELSQLYIHKDHLGQGIGSALLNLAKKQSSGKLRAYTFQRNIPAKQFYERHGFTAIAYGEDNEEGLPDILFEWQKES